MPDTAYSPLSDEELLLRYRSADLLARDELSVRYFRSRRFHLSKAAPSLVGVLGDWTFNEVFFNAYLAAESSFRFGEGRFISFFQVILGHEVAKEADKVIKESSSRQWVYFDKPDPEDGHYYLHDIIPDGSSLNDPKAFAIYAETLLELGKLPKGIKPEAVVVSTMLSDGYSLEEAASFLGLVPSNARMMAYRFRKWAKKVIAEVKSDKAMAKLELALSKI